MTLGPNLLWMLWLILIPLAIPIQGYLSTALPAKTKRPLLVGIGRGLTIVGFAAFLGSLVVAVIVVREWQGRLASMSFGVVALVWCQLVGRVMTNRARQ